MMCETIEFTSSITIDADMAGAYTCLLLIIFLHNFINEIIKAVYKLNPIMPKSIKTSRISL